MNVRYKPARRHGKRTTAAAIEMHFWCQSSGNLESDGSKVWLRVRCDDGVEGSEGGGWG